MKQSFSWISGITLIAFTMNPIGVLAYEPKTTETGAGIQSFAPANFNLSGLAGTVSGQMEACKRMAAVDPLLSALAKAGKTGGGGDCQSKDFTKPTTKIDCSMTCTVPSPSTAKSCDEYFPPTTFPMENESGTIQTFTHRDFEAGMSTYLDDKKRLENYIAFQNKYVSQCMDAEMRELEGNAKAYQCMQGVMDQVTAQASQQLQAALQQNQQMFGKYVQMEGEIMDQMGQIDEVLGGDPELAKAGGAQFGGLLGIQRDLEAKKGEIIMKEQEFKSRAEKLKQDIAANYQKLDTGQMKVMSACFKGENNLQTAGAYSRMCYRPKMVSNGQKDAQGNPVMVTDGSYTLESCSATDYIKDVMTGRSLMTAGGSVIRSKTRLAKADRNVKSFDSLMRSMFREMGDFDDAPEGASLVTRSSGWAQLEKKYGNQMDALSRESGIDVRKELGLLGKHCTNESVTWKKQQLNSAKSEFNLTKVALTTEQNKLSGELQIKLSDLNKSYGDAMNILGGPNVSLELAPCTENDPDKMNTCYTQIRSEVQGLLNGRTVVSNRTIKGGSLIRSFPIVCKGINGCVREYANKRKQVVSQARLAKQEKTKFVSEGNNMVQTQLGMLAKHLGNAQQSVINQFAAITATLNKMGVSGSDRPNFMKPEMLQPSQGPDKSMGPFQNPSNMTAVLSGMVQPTGLIDPQNQGVQQQLAKATDEIKKKKTALKEQVGKVEDVASKTSSLMSSCKSGVAPEETWAEYQKCGSKGCKDTVASASNDPNSVSNLAVSCDLSCQNMVTECTSANAMPIGGSALALMKALGDTNTANYGNFVAEATSARRKCDQSTHSCKVCTGTKTEIFQEYQKAIGEKTHLGV